MSQNKEMKIIFECVIFIILLNCVTAISDSNLTNNNLTVSVNVTTAKPLSISFVHYAINAADTMSDYDSQVNSQIAFIKSVYPIPDGNPFIVYDQPLFLNSPLREFISQNFTNRNSLLLKDLDSKLLVAEVNYSQRIVGVISENFAPALNGYTVGFSYPGYSDAVIIRKKLPGDDTSTSSAHEVGHTFDLCDEYKQPLRDFEWNFQNFFNGASDLCPNGDKNNDEQFDDDCKNPFADATGCPVENQQLIINLFFNGQGVTNLINMYGTRYPQDSGPYRRWIDKETYELLLRNVTTKEYATQPIILALSKINRSYIIKTEQFYTLTRGPVSNQSEFDFGNLTVETRDAGNQLLTNISIKPEFLVKFDGGNTTEVDEVPVLLTFKAENVRRIVFLVNGTIKTDRNVTPNTPIVTVTAPNGGEVYNTSFNVTWTASDADGDQLFYAVLISGDGGANFTTLVIDHNETFYTLNDNDFNNGTKYVIKVLATDGVNTGRDISNANFTIIQTNIAPDLNPIGNKKLQVNTTLLIDLNATDPDNDTLTFSKNVSFGSLNSVTGLFTWTPTTTGNFSINFSVTDNLIQDSEIINIEVIPIQNYPPKLDPIGDRTLFVNTSLLIDVNATDTESDPLTFGTNSTDGTFNTVTGIFTWTPNSTGIFWVTFNVTDNNATDNESIRIIVRSLVNAGAYPRIVIGNTINSKPWYGDNFFIEHFEDWAGGHINLTSNGFWNTSRFNATYKGNWTVKQGTDEFDHATKLLNHSSSYSGQVGASTNSDYLYLEYPLFRKAFQNFTMHIKMNMNNNIGKNDGGGMLFRWDNTSRASGYRLYKSGETLDLSFLNDENDENGAPALNFSTHLVFIGGTGWMRVRFAGEMLYIYNSTDASGFGNPVITRNISTDAAAERNLLPGSIGLYSNSNASFDEFMITQHLMNQTDPDTEMGLAYHNQNLTGVYLYSDAAGYNQSNVTFKWYKNGYLNLTQVNTDLSNINSTLDSKYTRKGDIWQFDVTFCNAASKCRTEPSNQVKIINSEPVLDPIPNVTLFVNTTMALTVTATDGNNDMLTYGTNATFGAFDGATGLFTWMPNATGVYKVKFNVSDTEDVNTTDIIITVVKIADEVEGREAIENGTNGSLSVTNRTFFTDTQVYIRYGNQTQKLGRFDKFVNSTAQRWAFNYNTTQENFTYFFNLSNIVNVWEQQNITPENITRGASLLVNVTKTP